jgi:hypothetical protein
MGMSMNRLRIAKSCSLSLVITMVLGWVISSVGGIALIEDARAVIGRPLTPVSFAGVARRTTRRMVYGSMLYAIPAGCATVIATGVTYYHCGGVYYRPQQQGANVVYVVVPAP